MDPLTRLRQVFERHRRRLYLVGGSVRNQLLGRPSPDYDLATDARPDEIKSLVGQLSPRAIYAVGQKFGTVGAVLNGSRLEITTFRTEEIDPKTGARLSGFGDSLATDLAHRDFTINALAQDLETGQVIDLVGGMADLRRGLVRAVGAPGDRFQEDPLRLLRAVRIALELDFRLDPETAAAIAELAPLLDQVARERIGQEVSRILLSERPAEGVRWLCDLGLMSQVAPEILAMRGMPQTGYHYKDVFEHVLKTVESAAEFARALTREDALVLVWSALLHDIAKPLTVAVHFKCRTCGRAWQRPAASFESDSRRPVCPDCNSRAVQADIHFLGHENLGADLARRILARLRQDGRTTERVGKLVRMHLRVNLYSPDWTDGAVRRFIREAGDEMVLLFALSRADVTSQRAQRVAAALSRVSDLETRVAELLEREQVQTLASPLDGNELMVLAGRPPGPWIKAAKEFLLQQVLEGTLGPDDKQGGERLARQWLQENPAPRQGAEPPVPPGKE